RIAVLGAAGRMGRAVIQAASAARFTLGAALDRPGAPELGRDAGELAGVEGRGVVVSADVAAAASSFDIVRDVTRPEGTLAALDTCVAQGKAMVIGTTGFSPDQEARIEAAAQRIAIVKAGNFSLGVNLCLQLLET